MPGHRARSGQCTSRPMRSSRARAVVARSARAEDRGAGRRRRPSSPNRSTTWRRRSPCRAGRRRVRSTVWSVERSISSRSRPTVGAVLAQDLVLVGDRLGRRRRRCTRRRTAATRRRVFCSPPPPTMIGTRGREMRLGRVQQAIGVDVAAVERAPRCRARPATSRGRSGASPRACSKRSPSGGKREAERRATRPRSRRRRCRARRDRPTARRGSSPP